MRAFAYLALAVVTTACTNVEQQAPVADLDPLAERYVRLALALGEHDAHYVDSYFGSPEWREQAKTEARSLQDIIDDAAVLAAEMRAVNVGADELLLLRQNFLVSHLESLATVAAMRNGEKLSFDEESRRVYGFVAPSFPVEHYDAVLQELEELLPGEGQLHERHTAFNKQFEIPEESYEAVIRAGIEECRSRTLERIELPPGEEFVLEMVSGNPWGAYNWYQGAYQGLIQVETSRPLALSAATVLGCHEGYPGHHTFSSLLEQNYLQQRGWVEFSIFPLFSPQGIVFEGSGDFAEAVAFPGTEKTEFLGNVISPLAGVAEVDFETYSKVAEVKKKMSYVGIEAARKYLDGDWDRSQAEEWLTNYAMVSPDNIDAWFEFTERYRAYRINYILGEDLVENYVRQENPGADKEGDWQALAKLLSYPPAPLLLKSE